MAQKNRKNSKDDLVRQALKLAGERGWENFSLSDIDKEHEHFQDKTDILAAFGRMIDRQVLENFTEINPDIPVRDQLFDIFMDRYEALNEYRPGVVSVLSGFKLDPKQAVVSMPHVCHSVMLMVEAAGIDTTGAPGAIKVAGATAVYMKGLKAWMGDESTDLSKTMAALDKSMARAEQIANLLGF